jgi:hypothetical protein
MTKRKANAVELRSIPPLGTKGAKMGHPISMEDGAPDFDGMKETVQRGRGSGRAAGGVIIVLVSFMAAIASS